MNMSMASSSVKKGETLIDTAMTLNAMHPDLLVVRHGASGAVNLLASKVNCAVQWGRIQQLWGNCMGLLQAGLWGAFMRWLKPENWRTSATQ